MEISPSETIRFEKSQAKRRMGKCVAFVQFSLAAASWGMTVFTIALFFKINMLFENVEGTAGMRALLILLFIGGALTYGFAGVIVFRVGLSTWRLPFELLLEVENVAFRSQHGVRLVPYEDYAKIIAREGRHFFRRNPELLTLAIATAKECVFLDWLSPEERTLCAETLRKRCINAAFIDSTGTIHRPTSPSRPELSLCGIRQYYCRWFWLHGALWAYLAFLLIDASSGFVSEVCKKGASMQNGFGAAFLFIAGVGLVGYLFGKVIPSLTKWRVAVAEEKAFLAESGLAKN